MPGECLPLQVAAILTLPFDVVKTQRQVALGAVEAVRGRNVVFGGAGLTVGCGGLRDHGPTAGCGDLT